MEKRLLRSLFIGGAFLLCVRAADAHFLFSNRNASIVLQEDSSLVLNAPVYGWKDRSIIKYISDDGGIDLREEYHDGSGCISFEDAPTELVYNNSNAIVKLETTNNAEHAAINAAIRVNSHALVALKDSNDVAHTAFTNNIRYNSNALLFADRINSNAIVKLETTNNAEHTAINAAIRVNSHALVALKDSNDVAHTAFTNNIRYNSNALLFGDRINSNAIVKLETTNNAEHAAINAAIRVNSHALVALKDSNDLAHTAFTNNIRYNSNALLFGDRINSNTAAYNTRINSNAINRLADRFNALFGAPEEVILTPDYHLVGDYWLDEDHQLNIDVDCEFDGRGHTIWFLRDMGNLLRIGDNATVTFTNVVLKDFDDAAIQLGINSQVIFGDGTVIELAHTQAMHRDWTFAGDARIQGFGNVLSLAGALKGHSYCTIGILSPGSLIIDDVVLDGIQDNNLYCIGDNATLTVKNSDVLLSSDYTFTAGTLHIEQDVMIKGPYTFGYETNKQSTIAKHSMLFFDMGTCFSYAPSIADRDLIAMEDTTSKLFLNGCDVCSTATGLRLTRGSLILDHRNKFNAQGSSLSEAIAFGNGIAERLDLQIMPGATIDVVSGVLDYAIENDPV